MIFVVISAWLYLPSWDARWPLYWGVMKFASMLLRPYIFLGVCGLSVAAFCSGASGARKMSFLLLGLRMTFNQPSSSENSKFEDVLDMKVLGWSSLAAATILLYQLFTDAQVEEGVYTSDE